jgi:hypothetical protein
MSLLSSLEERLLGLLSPILGPIRPLLTLFTKFRDNTVGILGAAQTLVSSVEEEYGQFKNLTAKPEWRHRVISVEAVIEKVQELIAIPQRVAGSIKDLISQVQSKLQPAKLNLDELEGIEDLRGIFSKLGTRLAAGLEKLLGVAALIVDALVTIRATIDDLQDIVDAIRTVREDFENLDLIFLQQKNPRRIEELVDGGSMKIRVGKMHS